MPRLTPQGQVGSGLTRWRPPAVGRHSASFERIRGDKDHPTSKGYTCEKALRLDHYQNGGRRLTNPLRKRADGTFEEIDWDTAIREVAAKFAHVRDTYGGPSIFYYGGPIVSIVTRLQAHRFHKHVPARLEPVAV